MLSRLAQTYNEDSWFKQNADMLDQGLLFASNTAILAAAFFRATPCLIPRCAKSYIGFAGLVSIEFQYRDLNKLHNDLSTALQHEEWQSALYTAAKTAVKAIDIFLTIGSCFVSAFSLAGYSSAAYYRAAIPVATLSWFSLIAFDVIDHYQNKALLRELDQMEAFQQEALCRSYAAAATPLARRLRRQFDTYRLNCVQAGGATFQSLRGNIKAAVNLSRADLALVLYGYFCLGVNRRYPETTVQALTAWSASALYTRKLIYRKYLV